MKQAAKDNLDGITIADNHLIIRLDATKSSIKAVCKDLGKKSCKIERFTIAHDNLDVPENTKKYLLKSLAKNTSITAFEVEASSGDEAAEYLRAISTNKRSSIRILSIKLHMVVDTTAGLEEAIVGLKLTDLHVQQHSAESAGNLFNVWSTMNTLQAFSYHGPIPTSELIQFLSKSQNLETLALRSSKNRLSELENDVDVSARIAQTLAALPKLKKLQLEINDDQLFPETFLTGLKDNQTITELDIDHYWVVSAAKNVIEALLSIKSLQKLKLNNFTGFKNFHSTESLAFDCSPLFTLSGSIKTLDFHFAGFDSSKLYQVIEQGTCLERIIVQAEEDAKFARGLVKVCEQYNPFILIVPKALLVHTFVQALRRVRVDLFKKLVAMRVLLGTKQETLLRNLPFEVLTMVCVHVLSPIELTFAHHGRLLNALVVRCNDKFLTIRECWNQSLAAEQ